MLYYQELYEESYIQIIEKNHFLLKSTEKMCFR